MRNLVTFAAVAVSATFACGGSDERASCTTRSGSYSVHAVEQYGSCGMIADQVVVFESAAAARGCVDYSKVNGCSIDVDTVCLDGTGFQRADTGRVDWNADGSRGTGTIYEVVTIEGGDHQMCASSYDFTYTRL